MKKKMIILILIFRTGLQTRWIDKSKKSSSLITQNSGKTFYIIIYACISSKTIILNEALPKNIRTSKRFASGQTRFKISNIEKLAH